MRSIHVAMIAFALAIPVAGAAQSPAVLDSTQPAPKKGGLFGKKGGLFGKAKALTQNKLVQTVAKTAVCNMVPGGQLIAGAVDKGSAPKVGKEAAAGAALGAANGKSNPCGMGIAGSLGAKVPQGIPGAGIPGMPTTVPEVGLSAGQMKQVEEQYRKLGMNPMQIKAMQQQIAMQQQMQAASPGLAGAGLSPEQMKQIQEQAATAAAPAPTPNSPAVSREKGRLVLRQLPWTPGSEAIAAGAEPVFAKALGDLAATMVNGTQRYKVEVRVENQGSGSKSRELAQRRVAVVIAELVRQGMPQPRLVANDGGADKDPRLVISETK